MLEVTSPFDGEHLKPDERWLVLRGDRRLEEQVRGLAGRRMVFFAGLPGTGKSLLVHQLAHVAHALGKTVHLLQWDVARPVFEASPAGRRFPLVDGVTHAVIRKAAGLWVRRALVGWSERHPGPEHLLVGEVPLIGGRFIEFARPLDDGAERLLADPSCRFVITVPSADVRRFLEAERERRAVRPLHPREREDAPPHVLRDLWRDLIEVGRRLGVVVSSADYDPAVYQQVYARVLCHRTVEPVALDVILPTGGLSVYDFALVPADLTPSHAESETCIQEVERRYPDAAVLEREVARWWDV